MITAYYHPGFAVDIGDHVMPMRKFALVAEEIRKNPKVDVREPMRIDEADLLRVHTQEYIDAIKTGEPKELAESQKFPWSSGLWPSVRLTNGAVLAAAKRALDVGISAGVASGFHHASREHGEGFCTFNGLVVAMDALRASGAIQRAAILDMDLHYGNGTAQLTAMRSYVFAISIYGNDYWDNTAYKDVTELHHVDGANHQSAALPAGCDRATMLRILEAELPKIESFKPDILLYQAGADPYFEDPYSPLALGHEDLKARDRRVFEFCRQLELPVAWVLAGGYTQDVSKVVRVHVNTFEAALAVYT